MHTYSVSNSEIVQTLFAILSILQQIPTIESIKMGISPSIAVLFVGAIFSLVCGVFKFLIGKFELKLKINNFSAVVQQSQSTSR